MINKISKIVFINLLFLVVNLGAMQEFNSFSSEKLLVLPYKLFNETENNGWRLLEKDIDAANLIIQYISYNNNLLHSEKENLYFFAAHLYGCANEYKKSIYYFEISKALVLLEKRDNFTSKDIAISIKMRLYYLSAIINFLKKDFQMFKNLANELEQYADIESSSISYVRLMVKNIDKTYAELFAEL